MKTRHCFVANSSSSSYVIALSKAQPCPHCGRRDPDLLNVIDNTTHTHEDTNVRARDTVDSLSYISEWYDGDYKEKCIKSVEECLKDDTKSVVVVNIGYHDDTTHAILDNMIAAKTATIIYTD